MVKFLRKYVLLSLYSALNLPRILPRNLPGVRGEIRNVKSTDLRSNRNNILEFKAIFF